MKHIATAGIVTLGCSRNLVDSEILLGSLKKRGVRIVRREEDPDLLIINTCAFIQPAREEAVETILEACELKKSGRVRYLAVGGCLPQLYRNEDVQNALTGVDLIFGTNDFHKVASLLHARTHRILNISDDLSYLYDHASPRYQLTPKHYAFLKISEGCNNRCSYCVIPRLRGSFRSREISSVLSEAKNLSRSGTLKELNIIGQDTTLYGIDRYGDMKLPELLTKLARADISAGWIRLLYTHPAHYSDALIDVVAGEKKICKYLDIPIQHINDKILTRMNRHVKRREIVSLIKKIRRRIPGITLRTSLIVGFPGEGEKEFNELLKFVKDTSFERLGVFTYSKEDRTPAAKFSGHLSESVKNARMDMVMSLQRDMSSVKLKKFLGKSVKVLVDEKDKAGGNYIARTIADAPDVDGVVYLSGDGIKVGSFYTCRITGTLEYDMIGKVA